METKTYYLVLVSLLIVSTLAHSHIRSAANSHNNQTGDVKDHDHQENIEDVDCAEIRQTLAPPIFTSTEVPETRRILAAIQRDMVITYTIIYNPADPMKKEYLNQFMKLSINLFTRFLKKGRTLTQIFYKGAANPCGPITVPDTDKVGNTGQLSDLHIYVDATNTASILTGKSCQVDTSYGPQFGYLNFRQSSIPSGITNMETEFAKFNNDERRYIFIHEFLHVLGLDSDLYNSFVLYDTPSVPLSTPVFQTKTILGASMKYITTPQVKARAQDHYGCYDSDFGLQLESSDPRFEHWEQTTMFEEVLTLTASIPYSKLSFTQFSFAFLQDTGFYWIEESDIEKYAQKTNYGKNKGCDFWNNACTVNSYPEFCTQTDSTVDCSYNGESSSTCGTNIYVFTSCRIWGVDNTNFCRNTALTPNVYPGDGYKALRSFQSKCFYSTARPPSTVAVGVNNNPTKCFPYSCISNTIQVSMGDKTITCTSDGQTFTNVSPELSPTIFPTINAASVFRCPSNIQQFCLLPIGCENNCSGNGYCEAGTCVCFQFYSGSMCQGYCPDPLLPQYNPVTLVCQAPCTAGQFMSSTGTCTNCLTDCETCKSTTKCTQCKSSISNKLKPFTSDSQWLCVATCETNQYIDNTLLECKLCPLACSTCTSYSYCNECKPSYYKFTQSPDQNCVAVCPDGYYAYSDAGPPAVNECRICDASKNCLTCVSPGTSCVTCVAGFYQFNDVCNASNCPDNSYESPALSFKCVSCVIGCKVCSNGTTCTTCQTAFQLTASNQCKCLNGTYLFNGVCGTTCPSGRFKDDSLNECTLCPVQCSVCTSLTSCSSCTGTYQFNGTLNFCVCPNNGEYYHPLTNSCVAPTACGLGYFADTTTRMCTKCDPICESCVGLTGNNCITCNVSYFQQISTCAPTTGPTAVGCACGLTCAAGTWSNSASRICEPCIVGSPNFCATCGSSSIDCQSCVNPYLLEGSVCQASCNSGRYPDTLRVCQACVYPCQECTVAPNQCTVCFTGLFLNYLGDSGCYFTCPNHYYNYVNPTSGLRTCQECSVGCKICDPSTQVCNSCLTGFQYNTLSKTCTCFAGTYRVSNISCSASCPAGYYADFATRTCVNCPANCNVCNPATSQCTTCISGYQPDAFGVCICAAGTYMHSGVCISVCPVGFFGENGTQICQKCNAACQQCTGGLISNCTQCNVNFYLDATTCYATCPSGKYNKKSDNTCQFCDSAPPNYCLTCQDSATQCLTCVAPKFRYKATCVDSCQIGTYLSSGVCYDCDPNCLTCQNSPTYCLTCYPDTVPYKSYYFVNNICYNPCPKEWYTYLPEKICQPCSFKCNTCIDQTQCTLCNDGTIPDPNDPFCACKSPFFFYENGCVDPCPTFENQPQPSTASTRQYGIYPNTAVRKCVRCPDQCTLCTSPTFCTECYGELSPLNGRCVCPVGKVFHNGGCQLGPCPVGTYEDEWRTCLPCKSPCLGCTTTDTTCVSCISSYFLDGTTCVNQCPPGQFVSGGTTCIACLTECATCLSTSSNCLSCKIGFYLKGTSCVASCGVGYLQDSTNRVCIKCSEGCEICSSATVCTQCLVNYQLQGVICKCAVNIYSYNGVCLDTCPPGTYGDNVQWECVTCPIGCATCDSSTLCHTCSSGFQIFPSETICQCSLPKFLSPQPPAPATKTCINPECRDFLGPSYINYFGDPATRMCLACDTSCKTCSGAANNQCLSCLNTYLSSGMCVSICPASTFANSSTKNCDSCDPVCLTCVDSATKCTSCPSTPIVKYLRGNVCADSCNFGEYADVNRVCQPCDQTTAHCFKCVDTAAKCINCATNYYFSSPNTCSSACPSGYFPQTNDLGPNGPNVCATCSTGCISCSSATVCTTCSSPAFKLVSNACSCNGNAGYYQHPTNIPITCGACPPSYYGDSSTSDKCVACPVNCTACTSSTVCTSCLPGYSNNLNGQTVCLCDAPNFSYNGVCQACPAGFFGNTVGRMCTQCTSPCSTCSTSATTCTACVNPLYLSPTNTCVSNCPAGYVKNTTTFVCDPCNNTVGVFCLECIDTQTKCTKCSSKFLLNNACVEPCPSGYFPNTVTKVCDSCFEAGCKVCSSALVGSCTECVSTAFILQNGRCLCNGINNYETPSGTCGPCPSNYYADLSTRKCVICTNSCATCLDSVTCLSCVAGRVLDPTTNQCLCGSGQVYQSGTDTCDASCDVGTYPDMNNVCQFCSTGCSACSSASLCTSCNSEFDLVGGQCVCTGVTVFVYPTCKEPTANCPAVSNYVDPAIDMCKPCPLGCNTCFNDKICLTCKTDFVLDGTTCQCSGTQFFYQGNCIDTCPSGYFGNVALKTCELCITGCNVCTNGTQCTPSSNCQVPAYTFDSTTQTCVCQDTYKVYNGHCVLSCPSGYYEDSLTKTCKQCIAYCISCLNPIECTQCDAGFTYNSTFQKCLCTDPTQVLFDNKCTLAACPAGYFADSNKVCQPCDSSCATCVDATKNCTGMLCANTDYEVVNGVCVCKSPKYLYQGSCVTCPTGTFPNSTTRNCDACIANCANCLTSGVTGCDVCATGYTLSSGSCVCDSANGFFNFNGTCVKPCPFGYFGNSTSQKCEACMVGCRVCSTAADTACSTCNGPEFITNGTGGCKCAVNGALIINNQCVTTNCPDQYYLDSVSNSCLSCKPECATCAEANACITCLSGFVLENRLNQCVCADPTKVLANGVCLISCPSGFYPNEFNICKSCSVAMPGCTTCNSATSCSSCTSSYTLTGNSCVCNSGKIYDTVTNSCITPGTCGDGQYLDQNQVCQNCPSTCQTCDSPAICLVCNSPFVISGTACVCPTGQKQENLTCVASCSSGFYLDSTTGTCQSCLTQCQTCSNSNTCSSNTCTSTDFVYNGTTCVCSTGLVLYVNECIATCPVSYYLDSVSKICQPCEISCLTCNDAVTCTACQDATFTLTNNDCVCNSPTVLYGNTCQASCPAGFYANASNVCTACPYGCLTCQLNAGVVTCLTCDSPAYSIQSPYCKCTDPSKKLFDGYCVSNCPAGYFADANNICQKCIIGCLTCSDAISCSICDTTNGYVLVTPDNVCQCPPGPPQTFLTLNTCALSCPTGFYGNASTNYICKACTPTGCTSCVQATGACSTCSTPTYEATPDSNGKCQCASPKFMNTVTNLCENTCPNGTYGSLTTRICTTCPTNCTQCLDPGTTNYCTQCNSPTYQLNLTTGDNSIRGACQLACTDGTYKTGASCSPCTLPCTKCSGSATTCTACDALTHFLVNSVCAVKCTLTTDFNQVVSNYACTACNSTCQTCLDPGTNADCTSCNTGYTLTNASGVPLQGECYQDCLTSERRVNAQTCEPCTSPCSQCSTSATTCTQCVSGYTIDGTTCQKDCLTFEFYVSVSNSCSPCNSNCATCSTTSTNCLSCASGYQLVTGFCQKICATNEFYVSVSNTCSACNAKCLTCADATSCLTCAGGQSWSVNQNDCITCAPFCSNGCTDIKNSCIDCVSPYIENTTSGKCEPICTADGFWLDPTKLDTNTTPILCGTCSANCVKCSSNTVCTQCSNGYIIDSGACIKDCSVPAGRYYEPLIQDCKDCNFWCSSCTSSSCTCDASKFTPAGGDCMPICTTGMPNMTTHLCSSCDEPCATCTITSSNCVTCNTVLLYARDPDYSNACVKTCPGGQTYTLASPPTPAKCSDCNIQCATCKITTSSCLTCNPNGYEPATVNGVLQCFLKCTGNNYRPDPLVDACSPCATFCNTCNGPATSCKFCAVGFTMVGSLCQPNTCPNGQWPDTTNQQCSPCDTTICANCATSATDCTSCNQLTYTWDPLLLKCVQICPSGEYLQNYPNGPNCITCPVNCATCDKSGVCLTCKTGYTASAAPNCKIICSSTQYAITNTNCAPCDATCATCSSAPKSCNTCATGFRFASDTPVVTGTTYTCVPQCSSTNQYVIVATNTCGTCSVQCSTCSGTGSNCLTCNTPTYEPSTIPGECLIKCTTSPPQFRKADQTCGNCASYCLSCVTAADNCLSCATNFAMIGGLCVPSNCTPLKQIPNPITKVCDNCMAQCQTCQTTTGTCITCADNYIWYNSDCAQPCLAGFYMDRNNICQQCIQPCKTCADASICSSCVSGFDYIGTSCLAVCIPSATTVRNPTTKVCEICDPTCATCSVTGPTSCTVPCTLPNYQIINGVCMPVCSGSTWPDPITKKCLPCDPSCVTCSDSTSTDCTSCAAPLLKLSGSSCVCSDATLVYSNGDCVASCPTGFFKNALGVCEKCVPGCLTCNSELVCLTCVTPEYTLDATTNKCLCQTGTFYSSIDQKCVSTCPLGTKPDTVTKTCQPCSSVACGTCDATNSCLTCATPDYTGTPPNCQCALGRYLLVNPITLAQSCVSACPNSTYQNTVTQTCDPCTSPACINCSTGPSTCTACFSPDFVLDPVSQVCKCVDPTNYVENNNCVASCGSGFFKTITPVQQCLPCGINCAQCIDASTCEVCADPSLLLQGGECVQMCNPNYYANLQGIQCLTCSLYGCGTCTSPTDCATCIEPDFQLIGSECKCKGGKMLNTLTGTCVTTCPIGTFPNYLTNSCISCTDITICQSCATSPMNAAQCVCTGSQLLTPTGTCSNTCPPGSIPNPLTAQCITCPTTGCLSCSLDALKCTTCAAPFKLDPATGNCLCSTAGTFISNNQCLSQCPAGTAPSTTSSPSTCIPCLDPGCLACPTTISQCTSCKAPLVPDSNAQCLCPSNKYYYQTKCLEACPSGTYPTNELLCLPCPVGCVSCTAANKCNTCSGGLVLSPVTATCECSSDQFMFKGVCYIKCPDGTYNNPTTKTCEACHYSCATCSGPNSSNCILCDKGYMKSEDAFSTEPCISKCDDYSFYNTQTKKCEQCDEHCQICADSPTNCFVCQYGSYFIPDKHECVDICPPYYYGDPKSRICEVRGTKCEDPCISCDSNNQCIECPDPLQTQGPGCVEKCGDGYYQIVSYYELKKQISCQPCDSSCLICNGPTAADCILIPTSTQFSQNCHYSCTLCLDDEHTSCVECFESRQLQLLPDKQYGSCICPDGFLDYLQPRCQYDKDNEQENSQKAMTGIFSTTAAISFLALSTSTNPVLLFGFFEVSQTVNFFSLINRPNARGFDELVGILAPAHPNRLIPYPKQDAKKQQVQQSKLLVRNLNEATAAVLTSNTEQNKITKIDSEEFQVQSRNPKIGLQKTRYFIINAIILIVIHATVWLLALVTQIFNIRNKFGSIGLLLHRIFFISLPIIVFLLTSAELSLMFLYQFTFAKQLNSGLDWFSMIAAVLMLVYFTFVSVYLFYHVVHKKTYSEHEESEDKFFMFTYFLKTKHLRHRLYTTFFLLRKFLTSAVLVFLYKYPQTQAICIFTFYLLFWVYMIVQNPYQIDFLKIISIIIETLVLIIHAIMISVVLADDHENQSGLTQWLLIMIFFTLCIFLVISIFFLIVAAIQIFRSIQNKYVQPAKVTPDEAANASAHQLLNTSTPLKDKSNRGEQGDNSSNFSSVKKDPVGAHSEIVDKDNNHEFSFELIDQKKEKSAVPPQNRQKTDENFLSNPDPEPIQRSAYFGGGGLSASGLNNQTNKLPPLQKQDGGFIQSIAQRDSVLQNDTFRPRNVINKDQQDEELFDD